MASVAQALPSLGRPHRICSRPAATMAKSCETLGLKGVLLLWQLCSVLFQIYSRCCAVGPQASLLLCGEGGLVGASGLEPGPRLSNRPSPGSLATSCCGRPATNQRIELKSIFTALFLVADFKVERHLVAPQQVCPDEGGRTLREGSARIKHAWPGMKVLDKACLARPGVRDPLLGAI